MQAKMGSDVDPPMKTVGSMILVSFCLIALLVHGVDSNTNCSICEKMAISTRKSSCADVMTAIDEDMLSITTFKCPTAAVCVMKCYQDVRCSLAVFYFSPSTDQPDCSLMSSDNGTANSIPLDVLRTHPCHAYFLGDLLRCQNCATPRTFSCTCQGEFYGTYCQHSRPSRCQTRRWVDVEASDHSVLQLSELPVKVLSYMTDGTIIVYHVDTIDSIPNGTDVLLLSEPILSLELPEMDFALPSTMEFALFQPDSQMVTQRVLLNGSTYHGPEVNNLTLSNNWPVVWSYVDGERVKYDAMSGAGNTQDIVQGLTQGHRLLSRTPIQVGFVPDSSSTVFMVKNSNQANYTSTNFVLPLGLSGFKRAMNTEELYEVFYRYGTGVTGVSDDYAAYSWELDDCWYPLQEANETKAFGILREAVLMGQRIRVILEDDPAFSVSADVVQVTLTPSDVIVQLAPYIGPLHASAPFDMDSTVVRKGVSMVSKRTANCTHALGKAAVVTRGSSHYAQSIQWFVDSREWIQVLKADGSGNAQDGSVNDLYVSAINGNDVRVCLEYEAEVMCISDGKIILTNTNHVVFQSRPFLKMAIDGYGHFEDFEEVSCREQQFLISTEGWVKAIRYRLGVVNDALRNNNVLVNSVTWFVQLGATQISPELSR